MTVRIAMWSGPRNISTAMMRSWENRPDCSVVDEPFYAAYLARTRLDHPMREQILQAQSSDYEAVVGTLTHGEVATALQYQKHMTHHIPRGMDMSWCQGLRHAFLIRDPAEVVASVLLSPPRCDLSWRLADGRDALTHAHFLALPWYVGRRTSAVVINTM